MTSKNQATPYKPFLKCCTFYPFLPNYKVGQILKESTQYTSYSSLIEMLRQRKFAIPIGLVPPPKYQKKFYEKGQSGFGREESLLCPYFDSKKQNCGIWLARPSECRSYFCEPLKLAEGMKLTDTEELYNEELSLSQEYMIYSGFLYNELMDNLKEIKRTPDECGDAEKLSQKECARFWGHIKDPISYYISAYDWVNKLKS